MAITRTRGGLSEPELAALRTAVDAGRKPKVMFTAAAGQIAGRTGQVIRLDDPGASDEWVVVRFGKDELPFAPADLALPERKAPAKAVVPQQTTEEKVQHIEPPQWTPAPAEAEPARAAAKPSDPVSAATATRPTVRKTVAKRAAPELTVTLSCLEGQWSVAAHKGAKALVKTTPVRASEALKMVSLLDSPPVQSVVEEIVEAARLEAEQQAERLREELAKVEAALADLREI